MLFVVEIGGLGIELQKGVLEAVVGVGVAAEAYKADGMDRGRVLTHYVVIAHTAIHPHADSTPFTI